MAIEITDANFEEVVLKVANLYWWIFGPNGAVRVVW